jgi:hypothetical protein
MVAMAHCTLDRTYVLALGLALGVNRDVLVIVFCIFRFCMSGFPSCGGLWFPILYKVLARVVRSTCLS